MKQVFLIKPDPNEIVVQYIQPRPRASFRYKSKAKQSYNSKFV